MTAARMRRACAPTAAQSSISSSTRRCCVSAGEWIELLRAERDRVGGATTGRRIGYSEAVVSAVLNGSYKGDMSRVQKAGEGALGGAEVDCPVIGSLPRQA